jgi:tetratricopeptide (TPR) repeat protein
MISEVLFYLTSHDLATVITFSGLAMLPAAAVFAASEQSGNTPRRAANDGDANIGNNDTAQPQRDIEPLKKRAAELERVTARSIEQSEELSDIYVELATVAYKEDEELETIIYLFNRAEKILNDTLAQGDDNEIRRKLGNVYLHRAVAYNDFDELDTAIESYDAACAVLKPLDDAGDGEAKYDIAGIRLNRGTIYHQQGDYQKAKKDLDESFLAFRAVEKISDLDTRFFMAKVSVAQGRLLQDMGEPLEKVVDAYNRAMRLFVELIDIGQMEHEQELANVLIDRCSATYTDYKTREFESEAERLNKIGDVLIDVGRGIEILERIVAAEPQNFDCQFDLFNAITTEGAILLEIEKYHEAEKVYTKAAENFNNFKEIEEPVIMEHFAHVFENRGICRMNQANFNAAIDDFNEAIELTEKIQDDAFGLDEDEKYEFMLPLVGFYANRATAWERLGDKERAINDCDKGNNVVTTLKSKLDKDSQDELESINSTLQSLREQLTKQ